MFKTDLSKGRNLKMCGFTAPNPQVGNYGATPPNFEKKTDVLLKIDRSHLYASKMPSITLESGRKL